MRVDFPAPAVAERVRSARARRAGWSAKGSLAPTTAIKKRLGALILSSSAVSSFFHVSSRLPPSPPRFFSASRVRRFSRTTPARCSPASGVY